jgi:excisionase family DNA binding protein
MFMIEGPQYLTINQTMGILGLSRPTVHRRIKDGSIPSTKIGGRILIPGMFFDQLLNKSMRSVSMDNKKMEPDALKAAQ